MTLRVGFLGGGFIARYHQAMLAGSGADHEIVAAYDPDAEKLAGFAALTRAAEAGGEDEVIEACDAVYVCTWTSEHERLVAAAAAKGRAVFCEKPLAFDSASAARMVDFVEQAGVVNQVGLVLRSYPTFGLLRELLADPRNGRVMSVVMRDDQYLPTQGIYDSTWRADPARAGAGTLLEHSIHDLDILQWLLGPIEAVSARSSEFHGIAGIEDLMVVTLSFASGAIGSLTSIWHDLLSRPSLRRIEIFCERAWFCLEDELTGPLSWTRQDGDEGSLAGPDIGRAAADAGCTWENPDGAFVTAATERTVAAPSFADALRAHHIADAVYASAAERGRTVDTAVEVP